jgi:long-chain fatty acid transport protein
MFSTRRLVILVALLALAAAPALAGGAINNNNFSSDYMRTLNRNAATDAADIVFYNPGAVTKLREGWTIKVDAQYITKDYSNTIVPLIGIGGGGELDQDEVSVVPGVFVNWRNDRWAAFFGFTNVAGGGKVDYDRGNWTSYQAALGALGALGTAPPGGPGLAYNNLTSQRLKAESTGLEYRVGGAYAFNDAFSLSAGLRYLDFTRKADGVAVLSDLGGANPQATVSIGFEEDATAVGGFVGLHFMPTDRLNIGLRYDSKIGLELDQKVTSSSIALGGTVVPTLTPITNGILAANSVVNGGKINEDLPAVLGLGVGYMFTDRFRAEFDYMLYFNKNATLDRPRFDGFDNSNEYGLALEYRFNPKWKLSGGYLMTKTGVDNGDDMLAERPELDAQSYSVGFLWSPNETFDLTVGLAKNTYDDTTFTDSNPPAGTGATVTLSKDGYAMSAGASFHF